MSNSAQERYFISLSVISTAIAAILILWGMFILYQAMTPGLVSRTAKKTSDHPVFSFITGAVVTFVFLFLMDRIKKENIQIMILGFSMIFFLFPALAGLSQHIGRKIFMMTTREGSSFSHLSSGWLVFSLASTFPYLGWFLIFPLFVMTGIGAVVLSFFPSREKP